MDAEKIYDRIHPVFTTVSLMRLGMPQKVEVTLSRTRSRMEHQIRTAGGISKGCIKKSEEDFFSGVGQWWDTEGPIWLAVEFPMIEYMREKFKGFDIKHQMEEGKTDT